MELINALMLQQHTGQSYRATTARKQPCCMDLGWRQPRGQPNSGSMALMPLSLGLLNGSSPNLYQSLERSVPLNEVRSIIYN